MKTAGQRYRHLAVDWRWTWRSANYWKKCSCVHNASATAKIVGGGGQAHGMSATAISRE